MGIRKNETMNAHGQPPALIGGHVVLDLVNTVSWRLDPQRTNDRLADFSALLAWSRRAGLIDRAAADAVARVAADDRIAAERSVRAARRLREDVHEVLGGVVEGGVPAKRGLLAIQPALVDAVRHAVLDASTPVHWHLVPRVPADLPRLLALATMQLLQSGDELRAVRRCRGAGCGWLFLDRSRSHTRRWCSSNDCGNRERVRRHYALARSGVDRQASDGRHPQGAAHAVGHSARNSL
jgi:predicted RNA-binding Zn ribbon-like protein